MNLLSRLFNLYQVLISLGDVRGKAENFFRDMYVLMLMYVLLPLIVRKYAVNDILLLLYEQPSFGNHKASMKIGK